MLALNIEDLKKQAAILLSSVFDEVKDILPTTTLQSDENGPNKAYFTPKQWVTKYKCQSVSYT